MRSLTYPQLPGRVVFGVGALDQLTREIELRGATRALVLSTPEQEAQAEDVAKRLGARCAGIFARAVMPKGSGGAERVPPWRVALRSGAGRRRYGAAP
jgi:hypothetical protein